MGRERKFANTTTSRDHQTKNIERESPRIATGALAFGEIRTGRPKGWKSPTKLPTVKALKLSHALSFDSLEG